MEQDILKGFLYRTEDAIRRATLVIYFLKNRDPVITRVLNLRTTFADGTIKVMTSELQIPKEAVRVEVCTRYDYIDVGDIIGSCFPKEIAYSEPQSGKYLTTIEVGKYSIGSLLQQPMGRDLARMLSKIVATNNEKKLVDIYEISGTQALSNYHMRDIVVLDGFRLCSLEEALLARANIKDTVSRIVASEPLPIDDYYSYFDVGYPYCKQQPCFLEFSGNGLSIKCNNFSPQNRWLYASRRRLWLR